MMKKEYFENNFVIICDSFEDRLDIYKNYIFDHYGVYDSDRNDYDHESDYETYNNIRWSVEDQHFVAHGRVQRLRTITSHQFRLYCRGHNDLIEYKKNGCDSSLKFTFSLK